jgi:transcriptional regulator with XRE-family HTH domain
MLQGLMSRIDARWFDTHLQERRLSRRQLARLMGIDPASVYRLLHGVRPMRMSEASQLANILGVPVGQVLEHAGLRVGDGDRAVPMAGWIDEMGEAHIDMDKAAGDVHPPAEVPDTAIALQARTAHGPLAMIDGWILFLDRPAGKGVPPDIVGRMAICRLDSGATLLRWVRRGYKPGTWNLDSFGGAAGIEGARLLWAQPVLYIRT